MYEKVMEQIQFEYTSFELDMTHTSRDNIFANAEQIIIKKNIYEALRSMRKEQFQEEIYKELLLKNNILDWLYLRMIKLPIYEQIYENVWKQIEQAPQENRRKSI